MHTHTNTDPYISYYACCPCACVKNENEFSKIFFIIFIVHYILHVNIWFLGLLHFLRRLSAFPFSHTFKSFSFRKIFINSLSSIWKGIITIYEYTPLHFPANPLPYRPSLRVVQALLLLSRLLLLPCILGCCLLLYETVESTRNNMNIMNKKKILWNIMRNWRILGKLLKKINNK